MKIEINNNIFEHFENKKTLMQLHKFINLTIKGISVCIIHKYERYKIFNFIYDNNEIFERCHFIDLTKPLTNHLLLQERILVDYKKISNLDRIYLIYNMENSYLQLYSNVKQYFQKLNTIRDFFSAFKALFIFFLEEKSLNYMFKYAFDFYDWIKMTFEFFKEDYKNLFSESIIYSSDKIFDMEIK